MTLAEGTKLHRYEILSQIGVGGMGQVYLAEDTRLHRKVALKVLPPDVAANRDRMRRFNQEATSAASLNHPSIAHIYEIAESEGINFIAMEYVEGVTLREKIHREQAPLNKLLRYLQHVAEGLAKAHDTGIVHRDLKPDNIMISSDGHAKILDFGLAKLVEKRPESSPQVSEEAATVILPQSTPGLILGTAGYMSPEQAQGRVAEVDRRSDIFSFGCILFEAITTHKAFEGKDAIDSMNKIIREQAPPISNFNPTAPADLQRIVRRCLAKDPEERYQSIKDVAIELKEVRREIQESPETEKSVTQTSDSEEKTLLSDDATQLQTSGDTTRGPQSSTSTRTSNAEYIVSGLKQHRRVALITAAIVLGSIAVGAYAFYSYLHASTTEVAIDSIAVLPFVNENSDPNVDWISDGLTESLINSLTQLPNLKVIARSPGFRYKGNQTDPIQVGKELGVRAVLTGRLQQRGEAMVISTDLIDVRDDKQLWGDKFERKLSDMLSVQREIAREITNNLRPTLSGMEQTRITKEYTANPEAYQLYLKGRFYWNKRTPEDFQKSIAFFQEAIEKDPSYALAYSGLADSYALQTVYTRVPPREVMPKAKVAALRALELDDKLAEAHASFGQIVEYYDYDLVTAEKEYRRAIELNPNYATAHQWLGEQLSSIKKYDEALREVRRALELDPLSIIINRIYGDALTAARRYDEAIEQYRKTIDLDPNFPTTPYFLGRAYEAKGMYDQAVEQYSKAARSGLPGWGETIERLKLTYDKSGWKAYLQANIAEFESSAGKQPMPAFLMAAFYARAGEKDKALDALEKAYVDRDFRVLLIGTSFEFDSLRTEPRFIDLMRQVGLPQ